MSSNYCSNCGEPLKEYALVCSNCGMPVKTQGTHENAEQGSAQREETVYAEPVSQGAGKTLETKSPFLAIIASFFIPGLGQVYNGRFWKGIALAAGLAIAIFLIVPGLVLLVIPGLIFAVAALAIWIWGMYDAYTEAEKMNRGELEYKEASIWEIIIFLLLPIIFVVLIVILIMILFIGMAIPMAVVGY